MGLRDLPMRPIYHRDALANDTVTDVITRLAYATRDANKDQSTTKNRLLEVEGCTDIELRFWGQKTGGSADTRTFTYHVCGWRMSGGGIYVPKGLLLQTGTGTCGSSQSGANGSYQINPITGEDDTTNDPFYECKIIAPTNPYSPSDDKVATNYRIYDSNGSASSCARLHIDPLGCTHLFVFLSGFTTNITRMLCSATKIG